MLHLIPYTYSLIDNFFKLQMFTLFIILLNFRFSGSLCGLVYIFTLPPLITLLNKRALWKRERTVDRDLYPDNKQNPSNQDERLPFNSTGTDQDNVDTEILIKYSSQRRRRTLQWWTLAFIYSLIMLFGLLNFIAQFVMFFTGTGKSHPH